MSTSKRQRQKAGRQARLEAARLAQQRAKRNRTIRNIAIAGVLLVGAAFLFATLGRDDDKTVSAGDASTTTGSTDTSVPTTTGPFTYGTSACPAADGSSPATLTFTDAPMQCIDPAKTYTAVFHTSEGDVTVGLDTTTSPGTTNNFVTLARYHYYDNSQLFRTDTSIGIIQGGGPTTNSPSDPGPGYTIPDEASGFTYAAGDLVMARTQEPNSSGGQFFFAASDAVSALDSQGTYLKFGHVSTGLDVLQAILALNVDDPSSGLGGHPSRTVTVSSIEIQELPAS